MEKDYYKDYDKRVSWDLTSIFKDDEELNKKIDELNTSINKITIPDSLDTNNLISLLDEYSLIKELSTKILMYGSLKYYQNTSDENLALKNRVEKINNEATTKLKIIENYLTKFSYDNLIKLPSIKKYKFYLDNLFRMQEYVKDAKTNEKIKDNTDLINKYINKQNNLINNMTYPDIQVEDKTYEITNFNMTKYLASQNRELRKLTFLSINNSFKEKESEFSSILNNIFALRNDNALLAGYQSVLKKSLFEENLPNSLIETLITSVHKNLPIMQKYLELKSKYLDIKDPHLYDLGVSLNKEVNQKYNIAEAINVIKTALKPLGKEYVQTVDILLDGHIDATPNELKHQSITFSWQDYAFLNFRGAYGDLKNLVHELGHIISYHLAKNKEPFIYADSTIFIGEIASIVNEILLNDYLYNNAKNKEEKIFFLSKKIENYFTSVFKQTLYTEFENYLYSLDNITANILSTKYYELLTKYYGSNIIVDSEAKFEWMRLGHLYRHSYYPYKYATGLLMASSIVTDISTNNLLIEKYIEFLKSGNSNYASELLKMVNIDITNSKTFYNGFKLLENDIKKLEKIMEGE